MASALEGTKEDFELATRIKSATRAIEAQVVELEGKMKRLAEGGERDPEDFPKTAALSAANAKLRHRAAVLTAAIDRERLAKPRQASTASVSAGAGLLEQLIALFESAVTTAFPGLSAQAVVVTEATKPQFGDYQYNSAMQLAQAVSKIGEKTNPRQVAEKILAAMPSNPLIEKPPLPSFILSQGALEMEIAGPGYINIFLNKGRLSEMVGSLLLKGVKPPVLPSKRVVVDYSAPNIAKEMHVGHLRSTIIGESICRLLDFVGYDVVRLNHVGDWGTQFGMLIAHLQDMFPDYRTKTPPIGHLQAFYKESKKRFDDDEVFKKRAYDCVVALQNHDEDYIKAWKLICDVSRQDFERIYKRLDVSLTERGESFYQQHMVHLIAYLKERDILKLEEGRQLMWVGDREVPLTVVKSDGGFTYDTSDLAALKHRLEVEKADWILYVVDAGQSLHLETVYEAGVQLGWFSRSEKRVEHVAFGVVLGEDKKKFKTRSGDTVRLTDLLDEGLKRSQERLVEKERDKELSPAELEKAAEAVAYGCVKYADLSHNRTADYIFSFDRMLDDRGNTAVYLLYALTRIRSIARKAGVSREALVKWLEGDGAKTPLLAEPGEVKLGRGLLKFPDVVGVLLDRLVLHPLCEYLFDLASLFSEFYSSCYCVELNRETGEVARINYNRLVLCEATGDVMEVGFGILGLRALDRM